MSKITRDKSAKFIELAEKRVNRALNDLKLIRNLSNKNYYAYSEDQSKKIIRALQQEFDLLKQNFQDSNHKEKGFKL
jgi:hypothetical protein